MIHQKWSVLKTSPKYVYSGEHTTLYINTKNSQYLSQCADIFTIIHFFVRSHSVGTFGMISISTTFTMELEPLINVFSSLFCLCKTHFSRCFLRFFVFAKHSYEGAGSVFELPIMRVKEARNKEARKPGE